MTSVDLPSVPFFRKLWVVVLLTCLILTFPIAMILLLTGDVFRKKGGIWQPLKASSRYVYGGLLALWLVAATLRIVMQPSGISGEWQRSADPDKLNSTSQAVTDTNGKGDNTPVATKQAELDTCDSADVAEMVKGALENNGADKVLDYGRAQETWYEKGRPMRRCRAEAVLNTGATRLAIQVFFGPSGAEMVQVEQGDEADQQIIADQTKKKMFEADEKEAQSKAVQKDAPANADSQSPTTSAPTDMTQQSPANGNAQSGEENRNETNH